MSVVLYLSFVVSSEARQLCPLELTTLVIQSGDIHTSWHAVEFQFSLPSLIQMSAIISVKESHLVGHTYLPYQCVCLFPSLLFCHSPMEDVMKMAV